MLASAFAGRLCDKYHNLMSWLKCVKLLIQIRVYVLILKEITFDFYEVSMPVKHV